MDKVVGSYEPLSRVNLDGIVVPAVNEHGYVVVPVQKYQLLLPQDNEVRVDELQHLGETESKRPEPRSAFGEYFIAYAPLPAVVPEVLYLRQSHEDGAHNAEQGQIEAPSEQLGAEVVALTATHVPLESEDAHNIEGRYIYRVVPVIFHEESHLGVVKTLLQSR